MAIRKVQLDDNLSIYATSSMDARFLYQELFKWRIYGDLNLPEAAVVVDLGANIGLFTLLVAQACDHPRIVAVEPVPVLASALRQNVALHGIEDVRIFEAAVGDTPASEHMMTYYPLRPNGSTLHPDRQQRLRELSTWMPARVRDRIYNSHEIPVRVMTVRDILPTGPIDLIKIDVVGSELTILRTLPADSWRRIRRVLIDLQNQGDELTRAIELLTDRGFGVDIRQTLAAHDDDLNYIIDACR